MADTKAEDSNTATSVNEEDVNEDELLAGDDDVPEAVENGEKPEEETAPGDAEMADDTAATEKKVEKTEDTKKSKDSKEEQVHKCGDCGAKFGVRHKLLRHINTNHNRRRSGDGPFTCADCNATYAFRSKYNKHKPFCPNRKDRPYVCVECSAGFEEKLDFHDHIRVHNWPSFDP